MYRMLIVDNEQYVVDSLVELFAMKVELQLEVIGVYSPDEAMAWLSRTKIDIVLTDIRMPGMSGLDLHKEIVRHWPRCQVIFLSGYDDFGYIQEALRGGSVNYILKTEDDEVILDAVRQAARRVSDLIEADRLMAESRRQMQLAVSALQKEYFTNLLLGDAHSLHSMDKQFQELRIPLIKEEQVLLIVGRVDRWTEAYTFYERSLLLYAIRNVASEYLDISVRHASFPYERSEIVWLVQPKAMPAAVAESTRQNVWRMTCQFVQGTFEGIQSTCKEMLGLTLSLAIGQAPVHWEQASQQFTELKSLYSWGLGLGEELLLVQSDQESAASLQARDEAYALMRRQRQIEYLASCMDNNDKASFLEALRRHMESTEGFQRLPCYYSLIPIFLNALERWDLHASIGARLDLQKLPRYDLHAGWHEACRYLELLAQMIFDSKASGKLSEENEVIQQVNRYVASNLGGDLSLTKIAETMRHNPSYLSRLYKQKTGIGLSEFILEARLEKAKELLRHESYKIHEVSRAVGFLSDPYFYRFFKRAMKMTPQEYRDSVVDRR